MKLKIKQVIFTDKKKDGTDLIRNGKPFYMLHINTEDDKWISKFYTSEDSNPTSKIKVGEEYNINYNVNGQYNNLISILDTKGNLII